MSISGIVVWNLRVGCFYAEIVTTTVLVCNARWIYGTLLLRCREEFASEAIYSGTPLLAPVVILLCNIEW
jgi:hypothetical protein